VFREPSPVPLERELPLKGGDPLRSPFDDPSLICVSD
jgi:hypothetical protein